jgi:DNA-binding transcriptional LysR family regulator
MIGSPLSVIRTIRWREGEVHPVYRDGPRAWEATVDIAYLEEFEVLARELNFGRAAHKSYVSRTAFSRHVRELEEFFGVELVARSRPAHLTSAGELLAVYLQGAAPRFEQLKKAMREVSFDGDHRPEALAAPAQQGYA